MGTTIGGLKALGAAGKITADIILRALDHAATGIEDKFSKTQTTISQAFENLETAFTKFVGHASGGAIDALTGSIDFLAKHLDDLTRIAGIAVAALGPAGLIAAARGATVAVGALSAVILANPVGALVSVLTAAAAALYLYRDRIAPLTVALGENRKAQDDLNKVLKDAEDHNNKLAKSERDRAIATAKATIADLEAAKAAAARNEQFIKEIENLPSSAAHALGKIASAPLKALQQGVELTYLNNPIYQPGKTSVDAFTAGYEKKIKDADDAIKRAKASLAALLKTTESPDPNGNSGGGASPTLSSTSTSSSKALDLDPVQVTSRLGADDVAKTLADGRKQIALIHDQAAALALSAGQADAYRWKMEALRAVSEAYGGVTEDQRRQIEDIAAAMGKAGDAAEALSKRQDEINREQQEAEYREREIQRGLEDVAVAGLHGFGSLKDAAASFLDSLAEMIVQTQVLDPLLKNLGRGGGGGFFGGLLGDLFGGGISPVTVTPSAFPKFANGTNFAPGGMAIVGERGPELVNLPRGSQVIPNIPQIRAGGGVSVSFSIDARGAQEGVAEQISKQLRAVAPAIVAAAVTQSNKGLPAAMRRAQRDSL
jgi:hypothetical protein